MTGAIGRIGWIQIDARDPVRLAGFWSAVLGRPVDEAPLGDPPHYVGLVPTEGEPIMSFQRVPEAKIVKNRLHLDIAVDDVDAAQSAIEALGGTRLPLSDFDEYGFRSRQIADPEGNEFCLIFGSD
jgi:predicted enzyme related to lactoylglutathione lyase